MSQGKASVQAPKDPFPPLDHAQIFVACRDVQLAITADDLSHPTSGRVQHIYAHWLQNVLGISLEDIIAAANEKLDQMKNPDVHRDALFVGMFHKTMCQLMEHAQINNFAISDLTAPKTESLVRNLSAIINLSRFERQEAKIHLESFLAEHDELLARTEELLEQNRDLAERIRQESESRGKNEPQVAAAEERVKTLQRQLGEVSNSAQEILKDIQRVYRELRDIFVAHDELQKAITTNEAELLRLKSGFVPSPERLRTHVSTLAVSLQTAQEDVRVLEHKERQLQAKVSAFLKYEEDLAGIVRVMDEWEIDVSKINEAESLYQKHVYELETLLSNRTEIESGIELIGRRLANAIDELDRFEEKTHRKRQANKERKKSLEEHYAQLVEQKTSFEQQGAAMNSEAIKLEDQIRAIRDELHQELDRGASAYKRVKDQMMEHSLRLNKAHDALNEANVLPLTLSAAR